ncbi:hypothetical protein F3J16_14255 [Burkholderia sp. Ap-962]|uniref:hypothetical protein n=1 Tax=Burkholderia sp. Ap-962 TaxID=2608333 RepID=UPI00141F640B|nr:hypothetical protein [Burkholderia sp. Ap-962]NIF71334.1 hypothetical protein [Burkholderia sp. Ap-962]
MRQVPLIAAITIATMICPESYADSIFSEYSFGAGQPQFRFDSAAAAKRAAEIDYFSNQFNAVRRQAAQAQSSAMESELQRRREEESLPEVGDVVEGSLNSAKWRFISENSTVIALVDENNISRKKSEYVDAWIRYLYPKTDAKLPQDIFVKIRIFCKTSELQQLTSLAYNSSGGMVGFRKKTAKYAIAPDSAESSFARPICKNTLANLRVVSADEINSILGATQ